MLDLDGCYEPLKNIEPRCIRFWGTEAGRIAKKITAGNGFW